MNNEIPIRIQFTCYNRLVAECIVQGMNEAERVYVKYVNLKHARNKPMGGACRYRADSKRYFDVPVGSDIVKVSKANG